jgi:hypothetical protein
LGWVRSSDGVFSFSVKHSNTGALHGSVAKNRTQKGGALRWGMMAFVKGDKVDGTGTVKETN